MIGKTNNTNMKVLKKELQEAGIAVHLVDWMMWTFRLLLDSTDWKQLMKSKKYFPDGNTN